MEEKTLKESSHSSEDLLYESAIKDWFCKHYAQLQADYIKQNHDEFMEFVDDMFQDRNGGEY